MCSLQGDRDQFHLLGSLMSGVYHGGVTQWVQVLYNAFNPLVRSTDMERTKIAVSKSSETMQDGLSSCDGG